MLKEWKNQTPYASPENWVFASRWSRGKRPMWGQTIVRKGIRPATQKLGINKKIGWHTFRHSYSTLLRSLGGYQSAAGFTAPFIGQTHTRYVHASGHASKTRSAKCCSSFVNRECTKRLIAPEKSPAFARALETVLGFAGDGMHPCAPALNIRNPCKLLKKLAGTTRLELATSAVTGQRSNQLNYVPSFGGKTKESGFGP